MKKSENLDDLKRRLLEAFDQVVDVAKADLDAGTLPNRTLAAELLKAASQMASSVTEIEREQREAREAPGFNKLKVAL